MYWILNYCPFPTATQAQQTAQEVFAAQSAQHLAATDPYNVNSLHFQTSQVSEANRGAEEG